MATPAKPRTPNANGRKSTARKPKSNTVSAAMTTPAPSDALIGAPAPSASAAPATLSSTLAPALTSDEQRRMIAEAAYYRAEQRGFAPGFEEIDWLEAEAQLRASNFRAA